MSREKQIEEMAKLIAIPCYKRIEVYGDGSKECPSPLPCNECTAELLYNAGYRQQEWISVDERLPDIDPSGKGRYGGTRSVRVLCACKQKGGKTFVKEGYYEPCGNGRVCWRIPGSIDTVTHWMPLPEPPKGE